MAVHTFVAGEAFTAAQANFMNTGADSGTYTPTLVGMAIGTGGGATNTANFTFIGGLLCVQGQILFGTSGTTFPSTTSTVTLPTGYTLTTSRSLTPCGQVTWADTGVSYPGTCWHSSSTTIRFLVVNAAGTYSVDATPSSTIPFTWAAGDSVVYQFTVRATWTP